MDEWKETLPEPLRDAPFIGKAESLDDAVGKLVHAAKLVGTSIRIPSEDASEDDKKAFYAKLSEVPGVAQLPTSDDEDGLNALLTKLGKPQEHTDYKLPELADFEWDEKVGNDLRQYALDAGLTTRQFNTLAKKIAEQEQQAELTSANEVDEARKALRTDWGDTLEEREALVRGWLEKSEAPESLKEMMKDRQLPTDTMNWLYNTAKQFKSDVTPISQDGTSPPPAMTPMEAREAIPVIIQDMLNIPQNDPRYRDLQRKLVDTQKLANPSEAA